MKVAAARIKDAVNKVIKGAGFNNLIPITSLLGIELVDGKLSFYTTDMTNNFVVSVDKVAGDDIDIVVDADIFSKLIAKTTSEEVEMTVDEDTLLVKGNGKYKVPLISDESGLVTFPKPNINVDSDPVAVKLTSIMNAYNINKNALAKTLEQPELTAYYCGDRVISTDGTVITFNDFKLMDTDPILIPAQMMLLLTLMDNEDIKCYINGTSICFMTDNMTVEGTLADGIEDYPVEAITAYLDETFNSNCKVPKEVLLSVIDRLSLFIEPYDKNGAYFTFGRRGINVHSMKDSSTEVINYVESKDFSEFTCLVDIPLLKSQLDAIPEDTVQIFYGNENAIMLKCGKVTQIIALLEDETE